MCKTSRQPHFGANVKCSFGPCEAGFVFLWTRYTNLQSKYPAGKFSSQHICSVSASLRLVSSLAWILLSLSTLEEFMFLGQGVLSLPRWHYSFSKSGHTHCSWCILCRVLLALQGVLLPSLHSLFHPTNLPAAHGQMRPSPVASDRGVLPTIPTAVKAPRGRQAASPKSGSRLPWCALLKLVLPFLYAQARGTKHFISEQMECQVEWCGGGVLLCGDKYVKFDPGLFGWLFSLWFLVQQKDEDVETAADVGCWRGKKCNRILVLWVKVKLRWGAAWGHGLEIEMELSRVPSSAVKIRW